MKRFLATMLLLGSAGLAHAGDSVPELSALLNKAAAFRPNSHDLVWRQIPWYTDPADALKQAREEKRPLFVWIAGGRDRDGDPLERC